MKSEFDGDDRLVGEKVKVASIFSGKFRRYNHLSFWQHLTIPSVVFGNLADFFKIGVGFLQSLIGLIVWRPDVVFCKGGFVCVPIGLAARLLRIPIVIHDSDAHPGLANRILARFAVKIATGAPLKFYNYPADKSQYVGIPVKDEFKEYPAEQRKVFKHELGFDKDQPLVLITGGGLGASRINNAVMATIKELTAQAQIVLLSGASTYEDLKKQTDSLAPKIRDNFYLYSFINKEIWKYLAAADLVVARAGATSSFELSALAKPTILVPNARLTGGHQVKNAQVYLESGAVAMVDDDLIETEPHLLSDKVTELISDQKAMASLGEKFKKFARPDAALAMAKIITGVAEGK